jgi:hypothetical protein
VAKAVEKVDWGRYGFALSHAEVTAGGHGSTCAGVAGVGWLPLRGCPLQQPQCLLVSLSPHLPSPCRGPRERYAALRAARLEGRLHRRCRPPHPMRLLLRGSGQRAASAVGRLRGEFPCCHFLAVLSGPVPAEAGAAMLPCRLGPFLTQPQARLVRGALEGALVQLKQQCPAVVCSRRERSLARALPLLSKSLAGVRAGSAAGRAGRGCRPARGRTPSAGQPTHFA